MDNDKEEEKRQWKGEEESAVKKRKDGAGSEVAQPMI